MHTGYEKEVANLKQKAQQLLKTSVRIDTCSRTKGTVEMGKLLQDHRAERGQVHSKRNRRPVVRTATKGI